MVVALAVYRIVALISARSDDRFVPHLYGVHNLGGGLGVRVLNPDQPRSLPFFRRLARRAHVSARADNERLEPRLHQLLLHKLAGVALGYGAHIETEQGVFYVDGAGLLVDDHLVEIGVQTGLLQHVIRRELRKLRLCQTRFAIVVPDA